MWVGRRGADPGSLEEVPLTIGEIRRTEDAVAAVVPAGSGKGGLLVLLTRPRVLRCAYSAVVQYTPAGGVRRRWTEVELTDGAGALYVPTPPGPALRVRLGRYDGPPAGPQQVSLGRGPSDGTERDVGELLLLVTSSFVAASSGQPVDGIRSAIVRYGITTGDVIDPVAFVVDPHEGRVAVVHDHRRRRPAALGAGPGRRPRLGPLPRPRGRAAHLGGGRSAPVRHAPAGGARGRGAVPRHLVRGGEGPLLAITPNAYPVSKVGELRDGIGILEVVNSRQAGVYRLSCGMPTAPSWGRGASSSGGGTPTTCGRGSADRRAQRPWLATAAAAAAASGSRYSPARSA